MADKTAHTAEPWNWDQGDIGTDYSHLYCDIYTEDETIIAQVNDKISKKIGAANARRIVACVNACAGVDTEKLAKWYRPDEPHAGFAAIVGRMAARHSDTKARADEAEALLATILLAIDACELADEIDAGLDEDDFCKQARAFINKANP